MSAGFAIQADRLHKKELGGGTVLDLGIYVIQLAQLVFGGEEPQQVASRRPQLLWSLVLLCRWWRRVTWGQRVVTSPPAWC